MELPGRLSGMSMRILETVLAITAIATAVLLMDEGGKVLRMHVR